METPFKADLRINNRNYPEAISLFLKNREVGLIYHVFEPDLTAWFKDSFFKGNRWNKEIIRTVTTTYKPQELENLERCFVKLFNTNKKIHKDFLRYLPNKSRQPVKNKKNEIHLTQKGYRELIRIMREMKKNKEVISSYEAIATFIKANCKTANELSKATIKDRLQNKKFYSEYDPKE